MPKSPENLNLNIEPGQEVPTPEIQDSALESVISSDQELQIAREVAQRADEKRIEESRRELEKVFEKEETEQKTPENENKQELNSDQESTIEKADNFNELYKAIEQEEKITGSSGRRYSTEGLVSKIESLRKKIFDSLQKIEGYRQKAPEGFWENLIKNDFTVLSITRTRGLRRKVAELLIKEAKDEEDAQNMQEDQKNQEDIEKSFKFL